MSKLKINFMLPAALKIKILLFNFNFACWSVDHYDTDPGSHATCYDCHKIAFSL